MWLHLKEFLVTKEADFSLCSLILIQPEEIWKTTSMFLKMEDNLNFLKKEDDLNPFLMEDNLNVFANERQCQKKIMQPS